MTKEYRPSDMLRADADEPTIAPQPVLTKLQVHMEQAPAPLEEEHVLLT